MKSEQDNLENAETLMPNQKKITLRWCLSKGIMPCLRQFLLFYCKIISLNKKNNKKNNKKPNNFITDNNS